MTTDWKATDWKTEYEDEKIKSQKCVLILTHLPFGLVFHPLAKVLPQWLNFQLC